MNGHLSNVPFVPDGCISFTLPEAIGDVTDPVWFGSIAPEWTALEDGCWRSTARSTDELSYELTVTPGEDVVDVDIEITNESDRHWDRAFAFNCFKPCRFDDPEDPTDETESFSPGPFASVADFECVRHWTGVDGELCRLTELPRKFGPRPTIQLYDVDGAPDADSIPFVANFDATPDVVTDGWLAIESPDSEYVVAIAADPTLFLFQNMEYSCIHSCPDFGALSPGETARARTRAYVAGTDLEGWYNRYRAEFEED